MLANWIELIRGVDGKLFLLSIFLFVFGYLLSIPVVKYSVKFLTAYPLWLWKKLNRYLQKKPSFLHLTVFLFLFNSISLLLNILSGFGVILPFIFTVWLGLNIGVIVTKEGGGMALLASVFLSPHAFFELPAAWLSSALGMQLGIAIVSEKINWISQINFALNVYFYIILVLLLVAAVIEAGLIHFLLRKSEHSGLFTQKPFNAEQSDSNDEKDDLLP